MEEMAERRGGADEKTLPPEKLFEQAWDDINSQLANLRNELDAADRAGLGDDTKQVIAKRLAALQKTVDLFAARWIDFERRRKGLEEKVTHSAEP
jgi:hypothetical protein